MAEEMEAATLALIAEQGKRARKIAARDEERARAKGDVRSADRWRAIREAIVAHERQRDIRLIADWRRRARSRSKG
jgi:hypothetical protein